MNKKHLYWIIPLILLIGFVAGSFISSIGLGIIMQKYPLVSCIYNMDNSLNVDSNKLLFTKGSQREAIQWRCAKEFVNFNITDYKEILKMKTLK